MKRFSRLAAFIVSVLSFTGGAAQAADVTFTPIGSPVWQPVGGELFSAPIGTALDNFAEFVDTQGKLMPSPNHQILNGVVVPGSAHAGPYDGEMSAGVTAQSYKRGPLFTAADFSNGNGVWVAFIVIPGA